MKNYLLPILIVLIVVINHSKPLLNLQNNQIKVSTSGEIFGHKSITIDEDDSLRVDGILNFNLLQQWEFEVDSNIECPQNIVDLSGKEMIITGFMYPLDIGAEIKNFCILKTTQTCCYGPKPDYNQYLFVETKNPVSFERLAPVTISGTFYVDENPDDGYIYRFEAKTVKLAENRGKEIDIDLLSSETGLPIFDYSVMRSRSFKEIDREKFIVEGFVTGVDGENIYLSHQFWDGVSNGVKPTPNNTIAVQPVDGENFPLAWEPKAIFIGEIVNYYSNGESTHDTGSLIVLEEAKIQGRSTQGILDRGFIPFSYELMIIISLSLIFLIRVVKSRKISVALIFFIASITALNGEDRVVASVNSVKIFESQVREGIKKGEMFRRQEEAVVASRTNLFIDYYIVTQELVKRGKTIPNRVIDNLIEEYRSTPPSMDICCAYPSLEEYLENTSMSEGVFRKQLTLSHGIDSLLSIKWERDRKKVMRRKAVDRVKKDYRRVWQIFFNVFQDPDFIFNKGEVIDKKRRVADEAYRLLKKGEITFSKGVKLFSEDNLSKNSDGYLGAIYKSIFGFKVREAITTLEENRISEPIESNYGFHILKVNHISDEDVESIFLRRYINQNKREFLAKLKKRYRVERFE